MKPALENFVLLLLLWVAIESTSAFVPTRPTFERLVPTRPVVTLERLVSSNALTRMAEGGPAVLDRPETVEKQQVDRKEGTEAWEIRLYNDPFNKREFVARCLATICGKSDTESFQIMMKAHNHGMGIVGRYRLEVAELYYKSLLEHGLLVEMVPVDDE